MLPPHFIRASKETGVPLAKEYRGSYYRMNNRATVITRVVTREGIVGEAYNHFELIETLANPYGIVGRLALDLMRLAA